jgi:hypothetical protein
MGGELENMNKDHILKEIQRTAKTNGGVPLGRGRFFQETGIKDYDWLGKYWARWSDAVREAGFSPNKFQGAYDETILLNKYIELVRELGHLPVEGELRLKQRKDPAFPNSKTFFSRFGSKKGLIERAIRYCENNSGYEDVADFCKRYSPAKEETSVKISDENVGFVYLIKSGRYYKIGRTNAMGRRQYELDIQLPEKANTVHIIKTDDPAGIEAYWHKRFESNRKNGEWFELGAEHLSAFKRRKFM